MGATNVTNSSLIDNGVVPLAIQAVSDIGANSGPLLPMKILSDHRLAVGVVGPDLVSMNLADNADDVAAVATLARLGVVSRLTGWNETTASYDRLRATGDDVATEVPVSVGVLSVGSRTYGFDDYAEEWGRIGGIPEIGDNEANIVETKLITEDRGRVYNGDVEDGWDRNYGNAHITVLASAARTATVNSSDLVNPTGRGAHIILNVTSITASPSVVFRIQGKDELVNVYYDILVSTAVTTTGTTIFKIYPGIPQVPNLVANDILPRIFRVRAEHADADSITYSVSANTVI